MSGPRPVLTVAELRAADAAAVAAGGTIAALMERAGAAVAAAVQARWTLRPVVVLCGPGDNGGDGFVVARRLARAGWPVTVAALEGRGKRSEAAEAARSGWDGPVGKVGAAAVEGTALVVDALFGAGQRPSGPPLRR